MRACLMALGVLVLAITVAGAEAELAQHGDLFVRFDGGIAPRALPRRTLAPIAVRIDGTIRVPARHHPPALREITIALNRNGRLDARGLPVCTRNEIDSTTPSQALSNCGAALVGGGGFTARTSIVGQEPETVPGEILLFNTKKHGHPAILAQMFQTKPIPINRLVIFHIRHRGGTFGTVINGFLPSALNRNGYLRSIFLQLQRRFTVDGHRRAYLMASCSAPRGISVASFPFASASMSFADGRTLGATLVRSCAVR